ncbi:MAG: uridine kinase [Oscillibacter sp.]|nr:uridine kinase [Oscillibacter sp.]
MDILKTDALAPLLAALNRAEGRVILAIDGGSCSGKSTLAAALAERYGGEVFHMDDFYLRPAQRTPERYAEAGGNVDRERFAQEVLEPLRRGERVAYRAFDCHAMTLRPAVSRGTARVRIVEGSYALHPALREYYDLTALLRVSKETQRERVLAREGERAAAFFERWIPLEDAYLAATRPEAFADFVIDVP